MAEPEKITIIEGPPPTFVIARDAWMLGLIEGLVPFRVALCRLRTFNGPALVERCYKAWREGQSVYLEYRGDDDLAHQAPIVAARWAEVPEGSILLLWVRVEEQDLEIEVDLSALDLDDWEDDEEESGLDMML